MVIDCVDRRSTQKITPSIVFEVQPKNFYSQKPRDTNTHAGTRK